MEPVSCVWWACGPATYRSTEAPVAIGFRRGARDTYAEYESPTLHRKQAWCMHVTRGSTQHRYTEIPRLPCNRKPSFWTSRTSRPHAIMQTRGGARKRVHDSGHPPTNESARGTGVGDGSLPLVSALDGAVACHLARRWIWVRAAPQGLVELFLRLHWLASRPTSQWVVCRHPGLRVPLS